MRSLASGLSSRQVGKNFGIDHKTVLRIKKKYDESGTTERVAGSGRPRKSTARDDRILVNIVKKDAKKTASDVTKYANEQLKLEITNRTARNILR